MKKIDLIAKLLREGWERGGSESDNYKKGRWLLTLFGRPRPCVWLEKRRPDIPRYMSWYCFDYAHLTYEKILKEMDG